MRRSMMVPLGPAGDGDGGGGEAMDSVVPADLLPPARRSRSRSPRSQAAEEGYFEGYVANDAAQRGGGGGGGAPVSSYVSSGGFGPAPRVTQVNYGPTNTSPPMGPPRGSYANSPTLAPQHVSDPALARVFGAPRRSPPRDDPYFQPHAPQSSAMMPPVRGGGTPNNYAMMMRGSPNVPQQQQGSRQQSPYGPYVGSGGSGGDGRGPRSPQSIAADEYYSGRRSRSPRGRVGHGQQYPTSRSRSGGGGYRQNAESAISEHSMPTVSPESDDAAHDYALAAGLAYDQRQPRTSGGVGSRASSMDGSETGQDSSDPNADVVPAYNAVRSRPASASRYRDTARIAAESHRSRSVEHIPHQQVTVTETLGGASSPAGGHRRQDSVDPRQGSQVEQHERNERVKEVIRGGLSSPEARGPPSGGSSRRPQPLTEAQKQAIIHDAVKERDEEILLLRMALQRMHLRKGMSPARGGNREAAAAAATESVRRAHQHGAPPHVDGLPLMSIPLFINGAIPVKTGHIHMLEMEERMFGKRSWKSRFVVADDRGLTIYKDEEAFAKHAYNKAVTTLLYRQCDCFVPHFRASAVATTSADGVSMYHPYAIDAQAFYFGFVAKQPVGGSESSVAENPCLLFRAEAATDHETWTHFFAKQFNIELYREMFPMLFQDIPNPRTVDRTRRNQSEVFDESVAAPRTDPPEATAVVDDDLHVSSHTASEIDVVRTPTPDDTAEGSAGEDAPTAPEAAAAAVTPPDATADTMVGDDFVPPPPPAETPPKHALNAADTADSVDTPIETGVEGIHWPQRTPPRGIRADQPLSPRPLVPTSSAMTQTDVALGSALVEGAATAEMVNAITSPILARGAEGGIMGYSSLSDGEGGSRRHGSPVRRQGSSVSIIDSPSSPPNVALVDSVRILESENDQLRQEVEHYRQSATGAEEHINTVRDGLEVSQGEVRRLRSSLRSAQQLMMKEAPHVYAKFDSNGSSSVRVATSSSQTDDVMATQREGSSLRASVTPPRQMATTPSASPVTGHSPNTTIRSGSSGAVPSTSGGLDGATGGGATVYDPSAPVDVQQLLEERDALLRELQRQQDDYNRGIADVCGQVLVDMDTMHGEYREEIEAMATDFGRDVPPLIMIQCQRALETKAPISGATGAGAWNGEGGDSDDYQGETSNDDGTSPDEDGVEKELLILPNALEVHCAVDDEAIAVVETRGDKRRLNSEPSLFPSRRGWTFHDVLSEALVKVDVEVIPFLGGRRPVPMGNGGGSAPSSSANSVSSSSRLAPRRHNNVAKPATARTRSRSASKRSSSVHSSVSGAGSSTTFTGDGAAGSTRCRSPAGTTLQLSGPGAYRNYHPTKESPVVPHTAPFR